MSESRLRFPHWLKRPISCAGRQDEIISCIDTAGLHTVCIEAKCPNRNECYSKGTATFLLMGNVCTRNCNFCSVQKGTPPFLDEKEPQRVVDAAKRMNLRHVVITSVTRDDIADGGATHFATTVNALKKALPEVTVEILVPDFAGIESAWDTAIACKPDVFNHNVETIPRLYRTIRPHAIYQRSLDLLAKASATYPDMITKSGLMVGLGEEETEIIEVMKDLHSIGCTFITIGQYLQPSSQQIPVKSYVTPVQFSKYEEIGLSMGFRRVFAGPFVRSSYRAGEIMR